VRVWWWVAYSIIDLVVYVGIFRWFYDNVYQGQDLTFAKRALIFAIWARAALLVAMFFAFLRPGTSEPVPAARPASALLSHRSLRVGRARPDTDAIRARRPGTSE
jgi:hypothetical protein